MGIFTFRVWSKNVNILSVESLLALYLLTGMVFLVADIGGTPASLLMMAVPYALFGGILLFSVCKLICRIRKAQGVWDVINIVNVVLAFFASVGAYCLCCLSGYPAGNMEDVVLMTALLCHLLAAMKLILCIEVPNTARKVVSVILGIVIGCGGMVMKLFGVQSEFVCWLVLATGALVVLLNDMFRDDEPVEDGEQKKGTSFGMCAFSFLVGCIYALAIFLGPLILDDAFHL